jgi:hypothetical protein
MNPNAGFGTKRRLWLCWQAGGFSLVQLARLARPSTLALWQIARTPIEGKKIHGQSRLFNIRLLPLCSRSRV